MQNKVIVRIKHYGELEWKQAVIVDNSVTTITATNAIIITDIIVATTVTTTIATTTVNTTTATVTISTVITQPSTPSLVLLSASFKV